MDRPVRHLLLALVLVVSAAGTARADDPSALDEIQEAFAGGDAGRILAALHHERLAALKDGKQKVRVLMQANDTVPGFDLGSGKPADWNDIAEKLVALAGGERPLPPSFPEGDPMMWWAKHEAGLFPLLLAQRQGQLEKPTDLIGPMRDVSRSEPGGMWTTRGYLRSFDLYARALEYKDGSVWGPLSSFVYLNAKMDQRPALFSDYVIPTGKASRTYGEVLIAKTDLTKMREKIEEGLGLLAPFAVGRRTPEAVVRRHNDFVDLMARFPDLEMERDYLALAPADLKESRVPRIDDLEKTIQFRLPLSTRWRTLPGLRGGRPALHVWRLSAEGVLERAYTLSAWYPKTKYTLRGSKKALKGSARKSLAAALAKAAAKSLGTGAKVRSPTKGTFAKLKGGFRYEVSAKRGKGYGYVGVGGGKRSYAIEVVEYGDLPKDAPPDVALFVASLAPVK